MHMLFHDMQTDRFLHSQSFRPAGHRPGGCHATTKCYAPYAWYYTWVCMPAMQKLMMQEYCLACTWGSKCIQAKLSGAHDLSDQGGKATAHSTLAAAARAQENASPDACCLADVRSQPDAWL